MNHSPEGQFSPTPQSSPGSPPPQQEVNDEAYCYALECLLKGSKSAEVRRSLLDAGYTAKQVDKIMQTALQFKKNNEANQAEVPGESNSANRNMLIGGGICLLGIVVTLFSLSSASGGGGRYIIAWGAILFGGIQFFRGFMQSHQR